MKKSWMRLVRRIGSRRANEDQRDSALTRLMIWLGVLLAVAAVLFSELDTVLVVLEAAMTITAAIWENRRSRGAS